MSATLRSVGTRKRPRSFESPVAFARPGSFGSSASPLLANAGFDAREEEVLPRQTLGPENVNPA